MNKSSKDCIYLRKSRNDTDIDNKNDAEILSRHEHQLLELAKTNNCNISCIYREVASGENLLYRPVMQQLLNEIEQGLWRSVLVMDLDRLARGNTLDQGRIMESFQSTGTRIVTPLKTYDPQNEYDEEYMEFGLFLSRREYRMINRRIQRGRHQSAKEGKYIGNKPPYGYLREKLTKEKGWTLIPHPQQAPIVRKIFQDYHGRSIYLNEENAPYISAPIPCKSVRQIVKELNQQHIPTASGKEWHPSTIYAILKNPVYGGYIKHKARPMIIHKTSFSAQVHRPVAQDFPLYPGRHPALVPPELISACESCRYQGVGTS